MAHPGEGGTGTPNVMSCGGAGGEANGEHKGNVFKALTYVWHILRAGMVDVGTGGNKLCHTQSKKQEVPDPINTNYTRI